MIALKGYRYDIIALGEAHLLCQPRAKRTLLTSYHVSDRMMVSQKSFNHILPFSPVSRPSYDTT